MLSDNIPNMKRADLIRLFPNADPSELFMIPVLDKFHEGIMITDENGVILYMNEAQAKIDDLKISDALGKSVTDLYRVDEGSSPSITCLKTGRAIKNFACYYRTHLGRVVNSIHNIYPIRAGSRIIGTICCITDYKNIERTFDTVGKTRNAMAMTAFGVSPVSTRAKPKKNGTCFTFDDIIGSDPDLLTAVKSAKLASDSPSPIMIFGETGTGKELFAQSIHNRSSRKARPYVAINCAAIPENLLEGMLFGTSKGAFTGAINKAGLIETAHGGTLFLDEVNSMSLGLQAKLLRFLQERKVRRVGSMREVDVDLKIVSSVNMPPHLAIDSDSLRADLFYRLAVVFIRIPSLNDRMGDLSRLITHFLGKTNANLGKNVTGIAIDVMERFESYDWPGNVRELEHVIEGAMNLMVHEKTIEMRHLSVPLQSQIPEQTGDPSDTSLTIGSKGQVNVVFPVSSTPESPIRKKLSEITKELEVASIVAALTDTRGNAAKAARRLGISPQLLNYKLNRFNIDRRDFIDISDVRKTVRIKRR